MCSPYKANTSNPHSFASDLDSASTLHGPLCIFSGSRAKVRCSIELCAQGFVHVYSTMDSSLCNVCFYTSFLCLYMVCVMVTQQKNPRKSIIHSHGNSTHKNKGTPPSHPSCSMFPPRNVPLTSACTGNPRYFNPLQRTDTVKILFTCTQQAQL